MAYTDDWETLMNGVFGPGGRFKAAPGTPAEPRQQPNSTLNDLNAALLEQQKKLDAMLKAQSAQLKTQDTAAEAALADSRRMLRDMENDGLLAKGTTDVKPEHLGSFEGLADEVRQTVLGQDAFVDAVVRAMRRPFVLGTEPPAARNVILLSGGTGTGRHFALEETARCMAARGLLQNDQIAALDLALYANPAAEKLFLQDLYAALHAPGEIVVFEHYESCCPSFLKTLSDLAVRGSAPLSSRYIVNRDGILVDAGTALAPGAVSRLDPCGKYLIFFSNKGRAAMADKFGASMVSALGDVCETTAYQQADLAALAAQQLNALAQKVTARLGLTLAAGADVRDYVAAQCTPQKGAAGLSGCCDRIFRALSEYCLQTDKPLTGTVTLTAAPEGLLFHLNDAAPAPLFDLLPAAYTGALDEIRAEISELVGLDPVKEYVFGLADNLQVQQRRAAAGMKTASLSMHMIFTGNPGTGKTTIARLVAKYLKAIGALKGGQLVEVGRGDLVGRYTGHTAPLTNSVIESALGGVLFIDEAYSLYRGEQDSFGLEAIDTLVKGMEDHRDELVVILAGYTREMETFLTAPAVGSGRIGGAVRAGQRRDRRTGTVGLDDMIGGLHRGGHIDHHAVFQLTVHPALAGGHGLLALRAVLQRGGAAGVAEVQAGVDILGIIGDGLRLDLVLIIDAVDHDAAACRDQLVQRRLGVVLFIQSDAGAFQRIGNGAKGHLHRILLVVGLDGHGECALDVQGSQAAAERGVIDMVALFGLHAGKAHHAGGIAVSVSADHQLPRTIGVSDVGQPQIRGGHGQCEQQAHGHDAERQHTGGGGTGAAAQCFLKFDGSDTEQLLSFYSLEYDAGLPIPAVARSFFTPYSGTAVRLFTSM